MEMTDCVSPFYYSQRWIMSYSDYRPTPQPYHYTPPPAPYQLEPYKRPLRRWANVVGGAVLLIQVVMLVVYKGLYYAFSLIDTNNLAPAVLDLIDQSNQLISYVLGFWIPIAFVIGMIKIPANVAFPMRRPRLNLLVPAVFVCLGASMVGSLLTGIVTVLSETLFGLTPIMPDMAIPQGAAANVVYIISMTLAPAIFEEMLFRGVILQSLRRFGDGFALVISSLLFAMSHNNLVQGPNAFLMGLVMGYFVLRTGSLLTGMVIHLVNNGLAVLFTYRMEGMGDQAAELLNAGVFAGYVLLGAISLVYLGVRYGNLFRLIPSDYPLPRGRKYGTFFSAVTVILCIVATIYLTSFYFV